MVAEHRLATPVGTEAIVETIVAVATALGSPAAVGVGAPGLVDVDGVLRFAPNLPGVVNVALRTAIEARLAGTRVRIENDASAAGWGEGRLGAAQGARHALMVTLGTGIGGGIIIDGELLRGASGFAGEIGHMVVDPNGPPCSCGKRGCWERLASGGGLGRLAREAAVADPGSRMVELAGGDADDVRGEHVTRAAGRETPTPSPLWRASPGGWHLAWPTWPPSSIPRRSSSEVVWWRPVTCSWRRCARPLAVWWKEGAPPRGGHRGRHVGRAGGGHRRRPPGQAGEALSRACDGRLKAVGT